MNDLCDKDATIRGLISVTAEYMSENIFDSDQDFKQVNSVLQLKLKYNWKFC